MSKAVIRTLPVQGAVQIKVMPHLSSIEACIIFLGGASAGLLFASWKLGKEMRENGSESNN